jgi:hypothetical protein
MSHCETSVFLQRRIKRVEMDAQSALSNFRSTGLRRYGESAKEAKVALEEAERDFSEHIDRCSICAARPVLLLPFRT